MRREVQRAQDEQGEVLRAQLLHRGCRDCPEQEQEEAHVVAERHQSEHLKTNADFT
jgi:hypothetical protein